MHRVEATQGKVAAKRPSTAAQQPEHVVLREWYRIEEKSVSC
jgi:hypothetical protein